MTARSGWQPLRMRCPNCEADSDCPTCAGTGWHPNSHALHEGFFIEGLCIAKVEAFSDDGPFYANAIRPDGEPARSGPVGTQANAMDWCERVAGMWPMMREVDHAGPPHPGDATERAWP